MGRLIINAEIYRRLPYYVILKELNWTPPTLHYQPTVKTDQAIFLFVHLVVGKRGGAVG
jgi:hypothetical protein